MAGRYKVMLLRVAFQYEIEKTASAIPRIVTAVKRWCRPAMHSKRMVGFVILTEETSEQLMDRLRPTLESITAIENYWCHTILNDVVGRERNMDPLTFYVGEAWQELRKRNDPKYVRKPERAETLVVGYMKDFDSRTAVKMGIKGRRMWQKPESADR
ncbi:hypothetical protein [Rhodoplanes sp. Z2-YC6860]|uniref:hypothetical protein n=1 Tax=Rhodoplanes sp. Z2-YC6860 TaxID=674703 RepID=UPI00078DCAA6|nr:hypothetical protein [Rhodoplanes sp. Z2-YC6860]AMN43233.1 hypothetical protein RHPLAN_48090 [Rhodoplanes sp. Z2-YC6860]